MPHIVAGGVCICYLALFARIRCHEQSNPVEAKTGALIRLTPDNHRSRAELVSAALVTASTDRYVLGKNPWSAGLDEPPIGNDYFFHRANRDDAPLMQQDAARAPLPDQLHRM